MTHELKAHLEENPQISNVYVNSKKQWQFYPKKGYDKVLSRDEVLKMKIADAVKPQNEKSE